MIIAERAKRFFNLTAQPGLRMLSLALLAATAYASTIDGTTFNVTGTFDNFFTLSGTIVIDTIGNGGILSSDLTVDPVILTFAIDSSPTTQGPEPYTDTDNFFDYHAIFDGTSSSTLTLDLDLGGTNNLDGYTGGSLCSDTHACGSDESSFVDALTNLNSGQLTPVAPEPSTALLAIAGGVLVALRPRKRRA